MLGIVTATLLAGGPRSFSIPGGITLNGYDPARPGGPIVSFPSGTGSSAHADARVKIEWPGASPLPIPNGYPFLRVVDGVLKGLMVVEQYVTLAPDPPATGHSDQELIDAAKRASYNAAADVSAMAVATAAKYPKP